MARLRALHSIILSVIAVLISGCAGRDVPHTSTPFVSDEVPWSFPIPSGWQVSTNRSEPDPNLRVGSLSTNISTVRYSFDFGQMAPGPNSGQGASEKLGPSAAVVKVLFHWYPADDPIGWNPAESSTTVAKRPTGWHDDAQNPGWAFRERRVCLAKMCVWIVEWHGPDASEDAIGWMERIAQSLQLAPGWADPTVQLLAAATAAIRVPGEEPGSGRHTLTCWSSCTLRSPPYLTRFRPCDALTGFLDAYRAYRRSWLDESIRASTREGH